MKKSRMPSVVAVGGSSARVTQPPSVGMGSIKRRPLTSLGQSSVVQLANAPSTVGSSSSSSASNVPAKKSKQFKPPIKPGSEMEGLYGQGGGSLGGKALVRVALHSPHVRASLTPQPMQRVLCLVLRRLPCRLPTPSCCTNRRQSRRSSWAPRSARRRLGAGRLKLLRRKWSSTWSSTR
jgi:hypothetical protein